MPKGDVLEALQRIRGKGFPPPTVEAGTDPSLIRLRGTDYFVDFYESGTVRASGRMKDAIEAALGEECLTKKRSPVFIVYGHDESLLKETQSLVERLGFIPKIARDHVQGAPTLVETLEKAMKQEGLHHAIVLWTGDDEVHKEGKEPYFQPRPNVLIELGMTIATLGRNKVSVLHKNDKNLRIPTDVEGVFRLTVAAHAREAVATLAQNLGIMEP